MELLLVSFTITCPVVRASHLRRTIKSAHLNKQHNSPTPAVEDSAGEARVFGAPSPSPAIKMALFLKRLAQSTPLALRSSFSGHGSGDFKRRIPVKFMAGVAGGAAFYLISSSSSVVIVFFKFFIFIFCAGLVGFGSVGNGCRWIALDW